jgi:23S rRNA U2552 (ribose-2'-O)-methylase RlmE/FtsJ
MKNMIHACEAKEITKNAQNSTFTYDCYIQRMSEQIRIAAKEGRDSIIVDVIEYSYHLNLSLNHSAFSHLMHIMMNVAQRHRFKCEEIICDGEYAFKISWAEN